MNIYKHRIQYINNKPQRFLKNKLKKPRNFVLIGNFISKHEDSAFIYSR